MLRAVLSLGSQSQFEHARWAECDRLKYKQIRVQVVSDKEIQYNTVLQTLRLNSGSMVLRTNYQYQYKPNQEIFYRNEWWVIRSVNEISQDIAPQSLAVIKPTINQQYILELVGTC